jgi:hypothetical protein
MFEVPREDRWGCFFAGIEKVNDKIVEVDPKVLMDAEV